MKSFYKLITLMVCVFSFWHQAAAAEDMPSSMNMMKPAATEQALFAGGCFWCMTSPFDTQAGVLSVESGYAGGTTQNPTYENYGHGGHIEVVQITYDPNIIRYDQLLNIFWHQIDPTDPSGQFVDRGHEYISAIFVYNDMQKQLAEQSKQRLANSGIFSKPIATEILPAPAFWKAEEYHQDYYKKNPVRYHYYRSRSGRDDFLHQTWDGIWFDTSGNQPPKNLKQDLSPIQYKVTQNDGTEPPFDNPYWDNKKPGIYVDIVSGEPLFSSTDKYDSGTGWPSFTKPLVPANIVEVEDNSLFTTRTEVRSKSGNSHLGHVFDDGPKPTGLRYCMNSAALRFIPADKLAAEGYGQFKDLFK